MSSIELLAPEVPTSSLEELELEDLKSPLATRQHYKKLIEDAEQEIAAIDLQISASLDFRNIKSLTWTTDENEKYIIFRREASKPRPILDRTLLLSAGVTPLQLQAGTKLGKPGKGGITVRKTNFSSKDSAEVE